MDINGGCNNCENQGDDCAYCYDIYSNIHKHFEPRKDIIELHRLIEESQAKLRKALSAIVIHKGDTLYYKGFAAPRPADKRLWETLEEIL